MKKYTLSLLIIGLLLAFSACNKWEAPEFEVPHYTGTPANHTLQDIINVYTSAGKMDSITHAGEPFIVKATVVSSDEGGNFYKCMMVQDETAAIQIQINKSGLCHTYPVGQTVYINCEGLVVGNYHGLYQIGWIYNGDVGRIDGNFLDKYLTKDGLPTEVTPIDVENPSDIGDDLVGKLVRIHNCSFPDNLVGEPWATETATTSRSIASINGTAVNVDLVVRTSNYAKFRKALIPEGTGDLVGVLSVYNSTYQLMLRTIEDVKSFGGVKDVNPISFANSSQCVYNSGWEPYTDTYDNSFMLHRAATAACEDWLISPAIDAATINGSTLYVEQKMPNADANVTTLFTVWYSTNFTGDPATADWHELPHFTNVQSNEFYNAEVAKLEGLTGQVHIRLLYKTPNSYNGNWAVKALHFQKFVQND